MMDRALNTSPRRKILERRERGFVGGTGGVREVGDGVGGRGGGVENVRAC